MYNLITKCTAPPLLAPRLKIFKLKFTIPPGIEPRTCWTRGRHATIWANATSCPPCCYLEYFKELCSYSMNIRFRVREAFRTNLELQIENKPWKVSIQVPLPDWPRRVAVASFRIAKRHDCLGRYLHHLGILPTPQCILCNARDDGCWSHLTLHIPIK